MKQFQVRINEDVLNLSNLIVKYFKVIVQHVFIVSVHCVTCLFVCFLTSVECLSELSEKLICVRRHVLLIHFIQLYLNVSLQTFWSAVCPVFAFINSLQSFFFFRSQPEMSYCNSPDDSFLLSPIARTLPVLIHSSSSGVKALGPLAAVVWRSDDSQTNPEHMEAGWEMEGSPERDGGGGERKEK